MAYGSIARAIELYGSDYVTVSCDRDGDGAIDTAATEAMLDVVDAMINGYLLGKIPLPLETVPLDLEKYAIDIAIYEMCPTQSVRTEEKVKRYDAAITWLKSVRDNKNKLTKGGAAAPEPAAGQHMTAHATVATAREARHELTQGDRFFTLSKLGRIL